MIIYILPQLKFSDYQDNILLTTALLLCFFLKGSVQCSSEPSHPATAPFARPPRLYRWLPNAKSDIPAAQCSLIMICNCLVLLYGGSELLTTQGLIPIICRGGGGCAAAGAGVDSPGAITAVARGTPGVTSSEQKPRRISWTNTRSPHTRAHPQG